MAGRRAKRAGERRFRVRTAGRTARAFDREELLPFHRALLERRLRGRVRQPIAVRLTDNVHTMVSFGRLDGRLEVRLHHMFVRAPTGVIDALGRYIEGGTADDSQQLDSFIERHRRLIRRIPAHVRQARLRLEPRGRVHDLAAVLEALNRRWFGGRVGCAITWSTPPRAAVPRQSIKLGSYSEEARVIRIHPALDQPCVPRFFVEWIVFHEMLHHVHGAAVRDGRRFVHTEAFAADERRFPTYERARAWEKRHIERLLGWEPEGDGAVGEDGAGVG